MGAVRRHLRIRQAKAEEAAPLSALARDSKAHWGYAPEVLALWIPELTISPGDIEAFPTFVAESMEAIVGFYQLRGSATFWTLEHLWVRPTDLRRGIGSKLLKHALHNDAVVGVRRILITADPNAAGFYEREGGIKTGLALAPLPNDPTRVLPIYEFQSRAA